VFQQQNSEETLAIDKETMIVKWLFAHVMMAQPTICIDRQAVSASRSGEVSAVRLASIWA